MLGEADSWLRKLYMANELNTTVNPHIKPMMKMMKPPLPSVLSPALEDADFFVLAKLIGDEKEADFFVAEFGDGDF